MGSINSSQLKEMGLHRTSKWIFPSQGVHEDLARPIHSTFWESNSGLGGKG
jgi:hypothetical protein